MEQVSYEYAGFQYVMVFQDGRWNVTVPSGQHSAAYKERHRRAAYECFIQDRFVQRTKGKAQ